MVLRLVNALVLLFEQNHEDTVAAAVRMPGGCRKGVVAHNARPKRFADTQHVASEVCLSVDGLETKSTGRWAGGVC